jgi:MerR family transcriptional regulator, light-induced transcriptional regulator
VDGKPQQRRHEAYPVRTVARLTSLSSDVIRAWERRYQVVSPVRGPRGARLYSRADVEHLRLLARAVAEGRAIGDVARLERRDLEELLEVPASVKAATTLDGGALAPLLAVLDALDFAAIDRLLGEALVALGSGRFAREIAAPFLVEVGERWVAGRLTVADEHLISGLLRNLLTSVLRTRKPGDGPTLLLATPTGERHEFGLLLVALLVVDAGFDLCYLGTDVPAAEIVAAATRAGATTIGIGVVDGHNRTRAAAELRALEDGMPETMELWLGGRDARAIVEGFPGTRALVVDDLALVERESQRLRNAERVTRAPRGG